AFRRRVSGVTARIHGLEAAFYGAARIQEGVRAFTRRVSGVTDGLFTANGRFERETKSDRFIMFYL
ncbi:MAG: hypothetical protein LBD58_06840, partial [Treponema sp.]|nr:hypothetical protein [Treponema sp.]